MKGLILAGGNGTRMRPLSLYTAKQLLPVLNKPVLFHNIDLLISAGITEIGIVVGPMKKYVLAEIRDSNYMKKANISFIDQLEPHGLAHAVLLSQKFLKDDNFIMLLGDNLFTLDLHKLISSFDINGPESLVALTQVTEPSRYGIAVVENNKIVCVQEKPKLPLGNWALAGLYIFKSSIHEIIDELQPSNRNEYEITDAIQHQIDKGHQVCPWFLEDYWCDIGTMGDLLQTNIDLLRQRSRNREVTKYRTIFSAIIPPVLIHSTAVVLHSIVGPNVIIGRNAYIKNSHIESSLVLENSVVENQTGENMIFSSWGEEEVRINKTF